MFRHLPPLKALRAFEATARYLSFTRAADELHVTQAAISHQVKVLEGDLSVRLFRRLTRRIELTQEGKTLLPVVREAFDRVSQTARALRTDADNWRLSVSVTPTFGTKWLAHQHFGRFCRQHPDIDLHLHHSNELVEFSRDDVDMTVRWGRGNWPELHADFLMHADLSPVCSPILIDGPHPIKEPEDLKHHTLLHERDYEQWVQWLAAARVKDVNPRRGPITDDPSTCLLATIEGQGVKVDRPTLIAEEIAAGRLVRPFELSIERDLAYYIVYPPHALSKPKVRAFRDFLLAEDQAKDQGARF